nr:hypothetical protein [Tessaracoccus bendigoensis]
MRSLSRIAIGVVAAATAMAGLVARPAEAAGPDVYTTPGGHIQNGRLWDTKCEKYSSSVVRCTTRIWATQVVQVGNGFRSVTGWHFNNLTYLPSARSAWKTNPLGAYGVEGGTAAWTSNGRRWRTECDTAATGRGGCRSYIWTNYVATSGGSYVSRSGWVFNNIVRFAQGSIPPVTKIPAHVLDQSVLTINGLGPLGIIGSTTAQRNATLVNYARLGYVKLGSICDSYVEAAPLTSRKLFVMGRADVAVSNTTTRTDMGAKVGMTVGQVKALYGSAFKVVQKENYGEMQYFGSVRTGNRELIFRVAGPDSYAPSVPLKDSDVIAEMSAGVFTTDVSFDGC